MNEAHIYLKRKASRWFQLHPRNWNETKAIENEWDLDNYGRPKQHVELLSKLDVPIYQQAIDERIPMSTIYPIDEVAERYGFEWVDGSKRAYLTSTASFMIALAVLEHDRYVDKHPRGKKGRVQRIHLAGIELAIGTEYFDQRPCLEYWCGLATGKGIDIVLPKTGSNLLTGQTYAYEHSDPLHPGSTKSVAYEFNSQTSENFAAVLENEEGKAVGIPME
tara:strand:- start:9439 stop:10098 length:660 start_codon:yes stop_codon:yes gene_type:complete